MAKIRFFIGLVAAILVGVGAVLLVNRGQITPTPISPQPTETPKEEAMKIESSAFSDNQTIPRQFTCDGDNINPPLTFSAIPVQTKSLVLVVDDPDAPGGTWVHWLLWNIAPETKSMAQGSVPPGAVAGTTSFGKPGYGGPCPPSGTHHYFFKLYALETTLGLTSQASVSDLETAMTGHIVAQAQLVGRYGR